MAVPVVFAVFVMLRASPGPGRHAAAQVSLDEFFSRFIGLPGHHVDALLGEENQRPLADAPRDDNLNPEAVEPARKRARLMLGRGQRFGTHDDLGVGVHFDDGELAAAAKMRIEAVVFDGNGNFHDYVWLLK